MKHLRYQGTVKLKYALLIPLLLVMIITGVIQCIFLYNTTTQEITTNVKTLSEDITVQYSQSLDQFLSHIEKVSLNIKTSSALLDYLYASQEEEFFTSLQANQQASKYLQDIAFANDYISSIIVYTDQGSIYNTHKPFGIYPLTYLTQTNVLTAITEGPERGYLPTHKNEIVESSSYDQVFGFYDRFYKKNKDLSGIISILISEQALIDVLRQSVRSDEIVFVRDGSRLIAPCADAELRTFVEDIPLPQAVGETVEFRNQQYLYTSSVLSNGWEVASLLPMNQILASSSLVTTRLVASTLMVFLIYVVFYSLLSGSISGRLNRLRQKMSALEGKKKQLVQENFFITEIVDLNRQFNGMNDRIEELLETVKKEQEQIDKTNLDLLRAQINPHFLYNTLDSINWMAMDIGQDNISEMCSNLAKLFRHALNSGKSVSTIQNELQHLEAYVEIQKYRFNNRFTYEVEVPEELLCCVTQSILLQPFVENCLLHGMRDVDDTIHILVQITPARVGGIHIFITDDGQGCDPDQLNIRLQSPQPPGGGYGIWNINQRIRLHHGNDYGVTYLNVHSGTKVCIHIPYRTETPANRL